MTRPDRPNVTDNGTERSSRRTHASTRSPVAWISTTTGHTVCSNPRIGNSPAVLVPEGACQCAHAKGQTGDYRSQNASARSNSSLSGSFQESFQRCVRNEQPTCGNFIAAQTAVQSCYVGDTVAASFHHTDKPVLSSDSCFIALPSQDSEIWTTERVHRLPERQVMSRSLAC
jgi:hypothetical protein